MIVLAAVRDDIADFLDALLLVYMLLIIAYIVVSLLSSRSARGRGYSRWLDAVLGFLRDVGRALPADLPPVHPAARPARPQPDRGDPRAADRRRAHRRRRRAGERRRAPRGRRAGLVPAGVLALDQLTKALVRDGDRAAARRTRSSRAQARPRPQHGRRVRPRGRRPDARRSCSSRRAARRCSLYFARHRARPLVWLPAGLLLGGALGNIVDRIRDGAVTDFLKLPLWPAFNVADIAITVGVLVLVYVLERRERSTRAAGPA